MLVLAPVALLGDAGVGGAGGHLLRAGYTRVLLEGEVVALDPLPEARRAGPTAGASVVVRPLPLASAATSASGSSSRCEAGVPPRRGPARARARRRGRARAAQRALGVLRTAARPRCAPEPALFSFNSPLGVCPTCRGFGDVLTFAARPASCPTRRKTLREGAIDPWARLVALGGLAAAREAREGARASPLDVPWRSCRRRSASC